MSDIAIGDYVKVIDENRVFKLEGLTSGLKHIPDGWFIEADGCYVNPKFCKKYEGAKSVFEAVL